VSHKRYDEEFKRNAVELLLSGRQELKPLARDLGVCAPTLRYWRERYLSKMEGSAQGPPRGPTSRETADELRRLYQENEKLRRQRDILKNALGILSEQSPGSMP